MYGQNFFLLTPRIVVRDVLLLDGKKRFAHKQGNANVKFTLFY